MVLIESKNLLSPRTLVLGSRCRIRLDNLEFRKISRDFQFFFRIPIVF
jgi:hypothetical protein